MNNFVRNLITEWRKLGLPVESDAAVVVGVSGGADSAALITALTELRDRKKLDLKLIAAHLDHGLRGAGSRADQAFVRNLAGNLDVQFVTATARIPKRGNLEQNARNVRYAFLAKTAAAAQANLVLTGHTMNDQAETFLLNLIRGSGLDGLSAMRAVRFIDRTGVSDGTNIRTQLVRPLLRWAKRQDTEVFCRDLSIDFRLDEMNDDPKFSRVKVRKSVIPLLEELNPRVIDTLCSTAQRINELRPAATQEVLADTLPISQVAGLPVSEMSRLIRSWLSAKRGTLRGIEAKHIEAVQRLILSRKSGRTVELPGHQSVSKRGGGLVFEAIMVEK